MHDVVFHRKITPFETQHKYVCLITCSRIAKEKRLPYQDGGTSHGQTVRRIIEPSVFWRKKTPFVGF